MEETGAPRTQDAGTTTKTMWCNNCDAQVSVLDGKVHRCKGCNVAVYCDKRCQREKWPQHKQICAVLGRSRRDMKKDSALIRSFLNNDCPITQGEIQWSELDRLALWFHIHSMSISRLIFDSFRWCCAKLGTSPRNFPLHRSIFTGQVRPQKVTDEKPGAMFYVCLGTFEAVVKNEKKSRSTVRIEEMLAEKRELFSRQDAELAERRWNARDRFLGTVPFLFWYGKTPRIGGVPILEPPPRAGLSLEPRPDAHAQLAAEAAHFQDVVMRMMARGHVLGPPGGDLLEDIEAKAKVGTMQKVDGGWVWVQMSDEDVHRFGYTDVVGI